MMIDECENDYEGDNHEDGDDEDYIKEWDDGDYNSDDADDE